MLERLRAVLPRSETRTPFAADAERAAGLDLHALLEVAPIAVLVVDHGLVTWGNRAARDMLRLNLGRLPQDVIGVTRDARLEDAIARGPGTSREVELVHYRRRVAVTVGSGPGESLIAFISDLTEVRRLESVRREFISNLTHELKTPIASLTLAAESLTGELPQQVRRRFAERVLDEAGQLTSILDSLRQLAEVESGTAPVQLTTFDLAALVEEVAARATVPSLRLEIPAGTEVSADRGKIAQVLGNLFDNALKFASAGGLPIEVSARRQGAEILVAVRDHGPGLSPEHWEKVFERLYKVDSARSRGRSGSGLGLAIAKHLVMAHGGRIWTELAPDGGQIFTFSLPDQTVNGAITQS